MSEQEVSRALALAIGYLPGHVHTTNSGIVVVWRDKHDGYRGQWVPFSFMDWNVIGPIAAKYNCFPTLMGYGLWDASIAFGKIYGADTPQKSIALAVIRGAKA